MTGKALSGKDSTIVVTASCGPHASPRKLDGAIDHH
jgi:hypothetical protein